jgi:hypothetical protein
MAPTHVLRVRRTDDPSAHLLLNVTQTSDSRPLDLKLVATEHEHLYHGSVKHDNVVALQASAYTGDDDEWKQVLAYTLLQERAAANLDALRGLEIVAAISGETCTLSLRKKFGDVVRRLGSISLNCDDEREEVSAFEWVETAVASSDGLRSELATLQASLASHHAQVASLTTQLDELVKAKKEHEDQLLRKCAALLDTKRAKIRDQQRELNALSKTQGRKPGTSSRGKRKANGSTSEEEDVSALDFDSGNENSDDGEVEEEDEEEEGQRTPEQATEDEDSNDGFAAPTKVASTKTSASTAALPRDRAREIVSEGKGKEDVSAMDVDLPPRRELPFARRAPQKDEGRESRSTKSSAPPLAEEEDDTDDEL